MALPLTRMLSVGKGKISWGPDENEAMLNIKKVLCSYPVLRLPDYSKLFYLTTDFSDSAIAGVLEQEYESSLHPVGFYSRKLRSSEINYTRIEKASLAIVASLDHFRYIIYGYPLNIKSDVRALEFLTGLRDGNSRLSGWTTKILKYAPYLTNFGKNKESWAHVLLSENGHTDVQNMEGGLDHVNKDMDVQENRPDEMNIVYTDGCCKSNGRVGASSSLGVFWGPSDPFNVSCKILGKQSNNRAEILAVCVALTTAIARGMRHVTICSDSDYVIKASTSNIQRWSENNWMTTRGKNITNGPEFRLLHHLSSMIKVTWKYTPAHQGDVGNEAANKLANDGSDKDCSVSMEDFIALLTGVDNHENRIPCEVLSARTSPSDIIPKLDYDLIRSAQDKDPEIQRIMNNLNPSKPSFLKEGVTLYKHPNGLVYAYGIVDLHTKLKLRIDAPYLPWVLRNDAIKTVHDSKWCCHGGFVPTCSRLLEFYFWSTFRSDVSNYIKHCDACQRSGTIKGKAPILEFIMPTKPFEHMTMDIVGPIVKSLKGNVYILNIVDIFSRFLISIPMPDQRAITVAGALEHELIARFGCPTSILTDRGSNFRSDFMKKVLSLFGIQHRETGPYRPQTNGLVERINREVKRKLTHLSNRSGTKWDESICHATFAYNNQYNRSIGYSPSELIYGRNLSLPNIFQEGVVDSIGDSGFGSYLDELTERLRSVRSEATASDKIAREKRMRYHNRKSRKVIFNVGDLVLYRFYSRTKGKIKGLKYRWAGPYRISKCISDVSYDIVDVKSNDIDRPIRAHLDRLKQYYFTNDKREGKPKGANINSRILGDMGDITRPVTEEINEEIVMDDICYMGNSGENKNVCSMDASKIDIPNREVSQHSIKSSAHGYNTRSKGKLDKNVYDEYLIRRGKFIPKS